jgi:hypothetical protein
MQTQAKDRQSAEEEIFALRKKIDMYARAGDMSEVSHLQLQISQLQQRYGGVTGIERKSHARGNDTRSEYGD